MGGFDVLVRGGEGVGPTDVGRADVGILDGLVVEIGPDLAGRAAIEIDARGLHVFPGAVDPRVHLNDPGEMGSEGFATGTAAFAAGGGTCLFDMPLNASPATVDGASFDRKVEAAHGRALIDFCLWGGLVPGDVDRCATTPPHGLPCRSVKRSRAPSFWPRSPAAPYTSCMRAPAPRSLSSPRREPEVST